jgi:NitT/TauT family transport system substrate-binding protein
VSKSVLVFFLRLWLLAACAVSGQGWAATADPMRVTLAVGGKATLYYLPLTVAERLGYFRDEGLTVEIADFPGGSRSLQALVGGSADVVAGAYEHTIVMQTMAQKLKAFVLLGRNPGISLGIARAQAAHYQWPKDLKGMKVGVTAPGSSTHMMLDHLLHSVGLKPDDVSVIGVGTGPNAVAAMRSGQIDALVNVEPAMRLLERSGDLVVVAETATQKGAKAVFDGPMLAGSLYARMEFLRDRPEATQALANAMVRALVWLQRATPEQVAALVPPDYLLGDKALYIEALARVMPTYSPDGLIPAAGVKHSHEVLATHNAGVRRALLWLDQTYDNTFVQKALQKYR